MIFYYLDFLINRIYKFLILSNIFYHNCIITFNKFFKMIRIKKFYNYVKERLLVPSLITCYSRNAQHDWIEYLG